MYDSGIDNKWNMRWREDKLFAFDEKDQTKQLFVIDTPPPFTSGDLHIGQVYWVIYVDSIARYMKISGKNVLYPQGWDTQGFPTELKVEKEFGRHLTREEFYKKCVEIAEKNRDAMKKQMLGIGASFDDRYEYVTMSKDYRAKVQLSLLEMHQKGMIYRSKHPVEWCSKDGTSIAREETEERQKDTMLNYLEFKVVNQDKALMIATTRPEYLHACVAVAVNPSDERYSSIIGKKVEVPLFKKQVVIIADEMVDKEFGTGAEMVCTFGDKNDVIMFYKHKLDFIDSIDEKGHLKNAGEFDGKKVEEAREEILKALEKQGYIKKREKITHSYKVHDRCGTPIELVSAVQWFIRTKEHAKKIREIANEIAWTPEASKQRLEDWSNYIEWDWNISRKRVFGTPIPFWYCVCGNIVAARKQDLPVNPAVDMPPVDKCSACNSILIGESDVCDVWVDSSITPLIIAGWPENKKLFERAFPASMRIQGADIIRTWTFYTILRTWALTSNKPFENLLVHGLILDSKGKEMHKSDGNGISPEDLKKDFPVDAIRLWAAISGSVGKDKPFSYEEINYAKGFLIKLDNSAKFIKAIIDNVGLPIEEPHGSLTILDIWILARLNSITKEVTDSYEKLNLYEAMTKAIGFYWREFCDYYIEDVKYRVYSKDPIMHKSARAAAFVLKYILDVSLLIFAPVAPHICEEINEWFSKKSIFLSKFPEYVQREKTSSYVVNGILMFGEMVDVDYEDVGNVINNIISDVRKFKSTSKMALNANVLTISIDIPSEYYKPIFAAKEDIRNICNSKNVEVRESKVYSVSVK